MSKQKSSPKINVVASKKSRANSGSILVKEKGHVDRKYKAVIFTQHNLSTISKYLDEIDNNASDPNYDNRELTGSEMPLLSIVMLIALGYLLLG